MQSYGANIQLYLIEHYMLRLFFNTSFALKLTLAKWCCLKIEYHTQTAHEEND